MAKENAPMAKHVEALRNFPFPNFAFLKDSIAAGAARLAVNRTFALDWAQHGIYAPRFLRVSTTLLTWLPFFAALGFVAWIIVLKIWIMFAALPLLLIGYVVFNPGAGSLLGLFRTGLIGLMFISLFYALFSGRPRLLATCIALVLIWYGVIKAYSQSVKHLTRAAVLHEDLLCALWQREALSVQMINGDKYWISFKTINGQHITY
jgi:hypothetical protein